MGIINKLFTFVGGSSKTGEAAQVNADFDALYNLVNGSIDDANISATANIQQSKILSLLSDMQARLLKAGDTMSGSLIIRTTGPNLRFIPLEANSRDWRIIPSGFGSNNGALFLQRNDGNEATPNWIDLYRFAIDALPATTNDVTNKAYVDSQIANVTTGNQIARVTVTSGDFSTSSASFVPVTDLGATVGTRNRRCLVNVVANVHNDGVGAAHIYLTLTVDGVEQSNNGGLAINTVQPGEFANASFSFITDLLSAANHTFQVYMRTTSSTASLLQSVPQSILTIMELPS